MQLQDALAAFQVQLRADGRSEHTRKQYERHARSLIAWLADTGRPTEIDTITPSVVAECEGVDQAIVLDRRLRQERATAERFRPTSLVDQLTTRSVVSCI